MRLRTGAKIVYVTAAVCYGLWRDRARANRQARRDARREARHGVA